MVFVLCYELSTKRCTENEPTFYITIVTDNITVIAFEVGYDIIFQTCGHVKKKIGWILEEGGTILVVCVREVIVLVIIAMQFIKKVGHDTYATSMNYNDSHIKIDNNNN